MELVESPAYVCYLDQQSLMDELKVKSTQIESLRLDQEVLEKKVQSCQSMIENSKILVENKRKLLASYVGYLEHRKT